METTKKIIIVGSGFAGLRLAQDLENTNYDVLLIDKNNYHQFQPLLYQVATARLEPASISFPIRKVFQHSKNIRIRIAEVLSIDSNSKTLKTTIADFKYDYLVLAYGCTTNYFGNTQIEKFAFSMKSVPEAIQLRNRILQTFEDTLVAKPEDLQALMNFVIVGGGPTGVELAGALSEMKKNILPKDYPDKDFRKLTVYLIEGSSSVLKPMSSDSQKKALQYLLELDVVVKTNAVVTNYDGLSVELNNGETIASKNVIWAAGIIGKILDGLPKEAITRGNRIIVNRKCEITALKDTFAIGDIAFMETPKYPNGHPPVASVAIEHSIFLADDFKLISEKNSLLNFEYHDKGAMATIGKRKAVVDLPKFRFQGRVAWFVWMLVHLVMILNLKNKLSIFINWIFSYFNNDSTLRVLIKPLSEKNKG